MQQIQDTLTNILTTLGKNMMIRRWKTHKDLMQHITVRDWRGRPCFYSGNGTDTNIAALIRKELKLSAWRPQHRAFMRNLAADLENAVATETKIYYGKTFLRRNHHGPGICLYVSHHLRQL